MFLLDLEDKYIRQFFDKVSPEPNSGCWLWNASTHPSGYGYITWKKKHWRATRLSYFLFKGTVPDHLHVCHKCDTPPCVNPEHLFLCTDAENRLDSIKKDRHIRGTRQHLSVLTDDLILLIRTPGTDIPKLAKDLGVDKSTLYYARRRDTWHHL